jgi:hypothetical protein
MFFGFRAPLFRMVVHVRYRSEITSTSIVRTRRGYIFALDHGIIGSTVLDLLQPVNHYMCLPLSVSIL